jgi:predicted dehydrogenase
MSKLSRRDVMKVAGAAAIAPALASAPIARAQATTASTQAKKTRLAIIGCGGMANFHTQYFGRQGIELVAVCDVDENHSSDFNKRLAGGKAFQTKEYREVLERPDVDVCMIATPDHWHSKIAIDAMRAGKDLYLEKPATLTVAENAILCKTVRQTSRVVQVGTWQRSDEHFLPPVALVHAGRLGNIKRVTVCVGKQPQTNGAEPFKTAPVPSNLDWERWQGQAPAHEYIPQRCHFTFRWWYEYSGGMATDWGAHHVDIAQWAVAPDLPGPVSVEVLNVDRPVPMKDGWPTEDNKYNTATKFGVRILFANGVEMLLHDQLPGFPSDNGILFEGDEGTLFCNREKIVGKAFDELKTKPLPKDPLLQAPPDMSIGLIPERHMANFLHCVQTRRQPRSDVFSHTKNLTTCHLAIIAMRLGRKIQWDATAQKIVGDEMANSFLAREQRKGYEVV